MAREWLVTFASHDTDTGVQFANTICVHDNGGVGGADPASASDLLDAVDSWLGTKYKDVLPSSSILDVLRATEIPSTFGDPSSVGEKAIDDAGLMTGLDGQLPNSVTLVMAFRSDDTSRRHQGRIHLPSPRHSGFMTGIGQWNTGSSYWTKCNTLKGALEAGHDFDTDNHLSLRVYSRRQHIEGTGDKTKDVSQVVLRNNPRWLNSRQTSP